MYVVPELNAEADDNAGIIRLPGSVQNRKKRQVFYPVISNLVEA